MAKQKMPECTCEWPKVMRAEEVARLLRCDRKTIYEAVGRGELPHVRLGRTLRFYRDSLLAWLAGDVNLLGPKRLIPNS